MVEINGNVCHASIMKRTTPKLTFNENCDFEAWRQELNDKLYELCGMDLIEQNACEPNMTIEEDIMMDGYRRIRFVFYSEIDTPVPCYLLIPTIGKEKYPLTVALQGHSPGFHRSVGIILDPAVDPGVEGRCAHGILAVKQGYAALCIEQRARGEREPINPADRAHGCGFQAHNALMLGRTTIGERVWDVMRALDLMPAFPEIDMNKIMIMGDSGGGTATFYTACFDERIKVAVPCYAFCPYEYSIMGMLHCACNYIPSAYRYFEMQDLACLIAPRKLLAVNGEIDEIFPIGAAKEGFETVKKIYEKAGCPENAEMFTTPKGHYMMPEMVWPKIKKFTGW